MILSTRRILAVNASRRISLEVSARAESRSRPARILSALLLSLFACSLGRLSSAERFLLFLVVGADTEVAGVEVRVDRIGV
jgi:hypothetical protein